jgi:type VI secretion system protein
MVRGVYILVAFAIALAALSCGLGIRAQAMLGAKLDAKVVVSEKLNDDNPVAVELIIVYDEDLLDRLLKMPAKEWFEKRAQIRRDYFKDTGFESWEWEWVPGQKVPDQHLPLRPRALAGVIFADYLSPGEHRARIDPYEDITINLGWRGFDVKMHGAE